MSEAMVELLRVKYTEACQEMAAVKEERDRYKQALEEISHVRMHWKLSQKKSREALSDPSDDFEFQHKTPGYMR